MKTPWEELASDYHKAMERALRHLDKDNPKQARKTLIKALGLIEVK